jgi:hypothetical protein
MKYFNISVSPIPFKEKPSNHEVGKIKKSLVSSAVTYNELIQIVSPPTSYSIAPAVLNGGINNESWQSQQLFMLDFDGTTTVEEVLNRFDYFGIKPNFYYFTFSHTKELPKFRVCLLVNEEITDPELARNIRSGLKKMFPTADKSCFDAARVFFGGKEVVNITDEPVNIQVLIDVINICNINADGGKTRNVMKCKTLYNKYLYYRDSHHEIKFNPYIKYLDSLKNVTPDWSLMADRVKVFRDFVDGKWLVHNELFGIATSLHHFRGGVKFFKETMRKHNEAGLTHYGPDKFRIIDYAAHMGYFPQKLKSFSPYDEVYEDLVKAAKPTTKSIQRVKAGKLPISLQEAQGLFARTFVLAFRRTIFIALKHVNYSEITPTIRQFDFLFSTIHLHTNKGGCLCEN